MSAPETQKTIPYGLFSTTKTFNRDKVRLLTRDGTALTHRETEQRVRGLARGLLSLGIQPGERVAILQHNSPEWIITDLAVASIGAVSVPVYCAQSRDEIIYILNDSAVRSIVFTEDEARKALSINKAVPMLKELISTTDKSEEGVLTVSALSTEGANGAFDEELSKRLAALKPEDLFSIIYTSGTTGRPKGVMLSHGNIISNIDSALKSIDITEADLYLSYLPLSHIMERMVNHLLIRSGAKIAYSTGFAFVGADAAHFKPTIMAGVPFFFERIKEKILEAANASGPIKKKLFYTAIGSGKETAAGKKSAGAGFIHSMVTKKVREKAGPNIRFFISGGAALSKATADFFFALGLPVLEGYGLTETSPVISFNTLELVKTGTVGKPIDGVEVNIAKDGEILVKGPGVMSGYLGMPEESRRALRDGWFHTGDVGDIDDEGFLTITDRKKDIIVTSVGKNISPQKIETLLRSDPQIKEALVYGSGRAHLVALIVAEPERFRELAAEAGVAEENILTDERMVKYFEKIIHEKLKGLSRYEQIRRFALIEDTITIEAGELTPTMKVKREKVGERLKAAIDALY